MMVKRFVVLVVCTAILLIAALLILGWTISPRSPQAWASLALLATGSACGALAAFTAARFVKIQASRQATRIANVERRLHRLESGLSAQDSHRIANQIAASQTIALDRVARLEANPNHQR